MPDPENILLVRLSSAGDVLLATPVAAHLRACYPRARITWLVDPDYIDLVRSNPHLDEALVFDYTGRHRGPAGIRLLARELAPVDLMVDLQHKVRTVLLAAYLHPVVRKVMVKRKGFGLVKALVGRDAILRAPHQVERYLALLDEDLPPVGPHPLVLHLDPLDREEALRNLDGNEGASKRVGLFPGARHPTKQWPAVHMAALADRCVEAGWEVIVLGGPADTVTVRAVADSMKFGPPRVWTEGRLGQLAALISTCQAVVSPDSGPSHMAAALGVPVVTLFGPTSPERWAPRARVCRVIRHELPCSPCSNHGSSSCPEGTLACMQAIEPEQVFEALQELMPHGQA